MNLGNLDILGYPLGSTYFFIKENKIPVNIKNEVLENAVEIYAGLVVEDGKPYRPCNGTEGDIFCTRWCKQCDRDDEEVYCGILTAALCGQYPEEWLYQDNKPICTAFERRKSEEGE